MDMFRRIGSAICATALFWASSVLAVQPLEINYVIVDEADDGTVTLMIYGNNLMNGSDLELWLGGVQLTVDENSLTPTQVHATLPVELMDGSYQLVATSGGGTVRFDDFDGVTIGSIGSGVAPDLCDLERRIAVAVDEFSILPACLPEVPSIPTINLASFDVSTGILCLVGFGTPGSIVTIYSDSNCELVFGIGETFLTGKIAPDGIIDVNGEIPESFVPVLLALLNNNPDLYVDAADSFGQRSDCVAAAFTWSIINQ